MAMYEELYNRTQYDGRDYMSVEEIYYCGASGVERVCKDATDAWIGITTCIDRGLGADVELRHRSATSRLLSVGGKRMLRPGQSTGSLGQRV
jgi:hypothetical protein